jgi:hypothetical protein
MNIYNILKNELNIKKISNLTNVEKTTTINLINKIDNEGQQMIFILINIFNKENNIEYQGQTINIKEKSSDIKFKFDDLPLLLQHIIHKFTKIHYNKMLEDIDRSIL